MKTITDINDCNSLLKELIGVSAQVWLFNATLRRLVLRLWRFSPERGVYDEFFLAALGCEHITGPFSWKDAILRVTTEPDKNYAEAKFKIIDEKAGFELIFSGGIGILDESQETS